MVSSRIIETRIRYCIDIRWVWCLYLWLVIWLICQFGIRLNRRNIWCKIDWLVSRKNCGWRDLSTRLIVLNHWWIVCIISCWKHNVAYRSVNWWLYNRIFLYWLFVFRLLLLLSFRSIKRIWILLRLIYVSLTYGLLGTGWVFLRFMRTCFWTRLCFFLFYLLNLFLFGLLYLNLWLFCWRCILFCKIRVI